MYIGFIHSHRAARASTTTTRLAAVSLAAALSASAALAAPAASTTAIIEINQGKALAGNVTPGDAAGFPVTLSQRGSYRLSGNLTVPANTIALYITAADVTLDFDGFSIQGPAQCSGAPPACNGSTGTGVVVQGALGGITVVNGTIRGMGGGGLSIYSGRVERMQIVGNREGMSLVRGIAANNVVQDNMHRGISIEDGGLAVGNTVAGNGYLGLHLGGKVGYLHNVLGDNNANGMQSYGGVQIGGNLCNFTPCP